MSTIENMLYGGNWQTCANCGVKDRPDQVRAVDGVFIHVAEKQETCADWKRTLAKATPADLQRVVARTPAVFPVEVTVPAPPKPKSLDVQQREKAQADLKAWAAKPYVNPHRNGKAHK